MSNTYPPPPPADSASDRVGPAPASPTQLPRSTESPVPPRLQALRYLIPEAFADGQIDFEKLRVALGDAVATDRERFGLNWPGKLDAMRAVQQPSTGTLVPDRAESVNFDGTEHVFIEGDNLEVLKLLQKSYHGKVKLIYIDPPYNTGGDFVYPDNFHEGLDDYLEFSKQVTAGGYRVSPNTETTGRKHSKWLSMMWPRLWLARNLLRQDGIVFVSIDDHEVSHMTAMMDEIFGDQNHVATLIWTKGHSAQSGVFKVYHEYIVCYARDVARIPVPGSSTDEAFEAGAMKRESGRHSLQDFEFPAGVRCEARDGTEFRGKWGGAETVEVVGGRFVVQGGKTAEKVTLRAAFTQKNQMQQYFYGDAGKLIDSRGQRIAEFYFSSTGKIKVIKRRAVVTPETTIDAGPQATASTALATLMETNESPMSNPKPLGLVSRFAEWFAPGAGDIILDFFAGSATTAHAVVDLNANDGGNRKCILVQLPQPTPEGNPYPTISAIGRERWRRVIKKQTASTIQAGDLGFRAFRLNTSCFKQWDADKAPREPAALAKQISMFADQLDPDRSNEAILFELMLRRGLDLSAQITPIELGGVTWYTVEGGGIWICPAPRIPRNAFEAVLARTGSDRPMEVIVLDRAFETDEAKANIVQQFMDSAISGRPGETAPNHIDIQVL